MANKYLVKFLLLGCLFISSMGLMSTNYYVNDVSLVGNIFTTSIGSNSNPGTAALPFATLTHVVNTVGLVSGDTVFIDAGNYNQTDKNLTLNINNTHFIGAGSNKTIFDNQAASADLNRWANLTGNNITIKAIKITGYNYGVGGASALNIVGVTGVQIINLLTDENKPGGGASSIVVSGASQANFEGGGANCNTAISVAGGGVNVEGNGNIVNFNNYSFSNNSKDWQGGSGLYVAGSNTTIVTVTNSIFADNRNGSQYGGAAIYVSGSQLNVYNSCFKDNAYSYSGGPAYGSAVSVARGATVHFGNCSFSGNIATSSGRGGAIGINTQNPGIGTTATVILDTCNFSTNAVLSLGQGNHLYLRIGSGNNAIYNINQCTFSVTGDDIYKSSGVVNINNSGNPSITGGSSGTSDTNPPTVTANTSCPVLVGSCYPGPCVNATPTGNSSQSYCISNNATIDSLIASPLGAIVWYDAAIGGNILAGTTSLVNGQSYYASDETSGCNPSDPRLTVAVTIVPLAPNAGLDGTLTICLGTTVTAAQLFGALQGAPAIGGVWSPALAGAGMYTYTQLATSPCTINNTATVMVSEQPLPPSAGSDGTLTICTGTTVTAIQLYSALTGTPTLGGVWTPMLAGSGTYTYTQAATLPCATDNLATVEVLISDTTAPTTINVNQSFCLSNNPTVADLSVIGVGVTWYSTNLSVTPLLSTEGLVDGEDYFASQMNTVGCESSTRLIVLVSISPLITANAGNSSYNICKLDSVQLGGTPSGLGGFGTLTYSWLPSIGLNNSTSSNPYVNSTDTTTYILTVTDQNLCSSTDSVVVNVYPLPQIDLNLMLIQNSNCGTNNGSITGLVVSGSPVLIYEWLSGSSVVSNSLDLLNQTSGSYTLDVTDGNSCKISFGPYNINDIGGPVLDVSGTTITPDTCGKSIGSIVNVIATGGVGPLVYIWVSGSDTIGNGLNLLNIPGGNYTIFVSDSVGCNSVSGPFNVSEIYGPTLNEILGIATDDHCNQQIGAITGITSSGGTGVLIYSWNNGTSEVGISPDLTNIGFGNYYLTVTDGAGCQVLGSNYVVANIAGPLLDTSNILVSITACGSSNGQITNLNAIGGVAPYAWAWYDGTVLLGSSQNLSAVPAGNYGVTVTDVYGCSDSISTITVSSAIPPNLDVTGIYIVDASCNGTNGTILGITITEGTVPYVYSWSNGVIEVSTLLELSGMPAGVYSLTVTDSNLCQTQSAPFTINNGNPPSISFTNASVENASCNQINGSILGTSISGGTIPYSYLWTSNGIIQDTSLNISSLDVGWYVITVTDYVGCLSFDSVYIDRNAINTVDANNDYVATEQNVGIQIYPLANDFGASSISILTNPINGIANGAVYYTPNANYFGLDSILYEICDLSCSAICDTAQIFIEIKRERQIRIYDGFSPNGDGSNETFYIENIEFFPENELIVYSRWGDVVFSAKPYLNDWDGSSKTNGVKLVGNKVVDGTYFFILKLTPDDDAINGTIDLRR